jgi:hypothetical protein
MRQRRRGERQRERNWRVPAPTTDPSGEWARGAGIARGRGRRRGRRRGGRTMVGGLKKEEEEEGKRERGAHGEVGSGRKGQPLASLPSSMSFPRGDHGDNTAPPSHARGVSRMRTVSLSLIITQKNQEEEKHSRSSPLFITQPPPPASIHPLSLPFTRPPSSPSPPPSHFSPCSSCWARTALSSPSPCSPCPAPTPAAPCPLSRTPWARRPGRCWF